MNNRTWISLLLIFAGLGFALQGGPTQPDYMQFEPADMPDLVNMYTGDFAYSVPLGEVPGPYGGFPISMSYHAGISPQQEASWVGLGWTLNPGAINRNMRGVPDDQFHGGTLGFIYQYSAMSTWGVNMGYSNGVVSVGLTVSSHGGVGFNATVGPKLGGVVGLGLSVGTDGVGVSASAGPEGSPLSVNGSLMIGPKGKPTVSAGLGISGTNGAGGAVGASVGASYTPGSGIAKQASFSAGQANGYSVGLSVSGNGVTPFMKYSMKMENGGTAVAVQAVGLSVSNMNNGNTSSKATSSTVGLIIPTTIGVFSFGYNSTLYESWVRQATSEYTYGYMYQAGPAIVADAKTNNVLSVPSTGNGSHTGSGNIPWEWNFKGRSLEYVGTPGDDLHPAYDIYMVASPGVSGTFRPFAASEHAMYMSLRSETKDGAPSPYSYLLEADPNSSDVQNAQHSNEYESMLSIDKYFPVLYAYHYKFQGTDKTVYSPSEQYASPKDAIDEGVSPYAYFKTRYINESNRMVYLATPGDGDRVRSRMEFRFIGHGAGYYESEDSELAMRKGEDYIQGENFQRKVNGWNYGLIGSQRIEPILEDDSPVGGLQGFRIIAADGSKYIFKQPVRSYLKVDYSINRERGFPLFVDKKSSVDKEFLNNIGVAFKEIFKTLVTTAFFPAKAIYDAITAKGHMTENCKSGTEGQDEDYLYSYQVNMNPYATQWLLTEVQGSDFVDLANGDETKMSQNLGNHVLLHYSAPTIYRWRFPFARPYGDPMQAQNYRQPRLGETPAGCSADMFTASFGYKESVYLESIETATHKAVFHLNENERVDGKGWEMAEKSHTKPTVQMPIFTAATLRMSSSINDGNKAVATGFGENKIYHKYFPVRYNITEVYFNNKITDSIAKRLEGQTIQITGIGSPEQGEYEGYKINLNDKSDLVNVISVKVMKFEKVSKGETQWGLYKFTVEGSLEGRYYSDQSYNKVVSNNMNGNSESTSIWLGENAEENLEESGIRFSKAVVPFIDWAGVYRLGANDNQMRSLDSITYCRKKADGTCNASYRTFAFGYDYSLQPGTLNSYCSGKYPASVDEMRSSPASTAYGVCESSPSTKSLYGKLTLQSITESACRDGSCAALPPFRFGYNSPTASSLRLGSLDAYKARNAQTLAWYNLKDGEVVDNSTGLGEMDDMDVTIMNSNDQTDEWGFWNWNAHAENHKVNQEGADYAASAWSLQKIVDPAGGVMEIEYERDTYKGTSFEAEQKYANIYDFGKCSDFIKGTDYDSKTCVVFGPMYWKKDCLAGKPAYWEAGAKNGQSFDYLKSLGIETKDNAITKAYFNVSSIVKTKVDCGLWGMGSCTRSRSAALYGSGQLIKIGELTRKDITIEGKLGNEWSARFKTADYSDLDEDGDMAAFVYALSDHEWTEIENGLLRSAKKINEDHWDVKEEGRYGSLFVGQSSDRLKGGDIRVKRLTRHDMGVTQSTEYQYEFARDDKSIQAGEMPQLPDSAMNAVLATRTMSTKLNTGMPNMFAEPKSRIVGIGDEELYYLPESKVVYPRVQVRNGRNGDMINGYTEFRYVTPETGVPETYITPISDVVLPFIRLNLRLWYLNNQANENWGGIVAHIKAIDSDNNSRSFNAYLFENSENSVYFYKDNNGFDPAKLKEIEISCPALNEKAAGIIKTITLPSNSIGKYREAWVAVLVNTKDKELKDAALTGSRAQSIGHVPILYKEVAYTSTKVNCPKCEEKDIYADVESKVVYHDLSAFIGKNISTTFYRVRQNPKKIIIPVRADSMVYSVQVPSVRNDAFDKVPSNWNKLGQQKENWKFTGSLDCKDEEGDACKNAYPKVFGRANKKYSKSVALVRYPVFVVEAVNRTGFENQEGQANDAKMMVQRTTNHEFDPLTGAPTLTVAHSSLGNGKEIRKATRITPHWYLSKVSGSSVASEMFERNMLAQNFLEEVYSWDNVNESLDNRSLPRANLRSVSVSPYNYVTPLLPSSVQSELTGKRKPIVALGSFTSKVDPTKLADGEWNQFQDKEPGLDKYNGTHILAVDRFYKVNESVDGLSRKLSAYYSADGLYQTGLFYPAARVATAQWVSSNPYGDEQNGKAAQSFELSAVDGSLVAEFQVQAGLNSSVTLSYGGVTETLKLAAGVKSYRVVLGKSANGTVNAQFSGLAYLRYFRAYPQGCQAKSYRYDAYGSMIQAVDERNVSTYYEYDVFGNVQQIRNDDGVVFKSHSREMVNGGV